MDIQRRFALPFAVKKVLDGHDPGPVLDAGIKHRPVTGVKREHILPEGTGAPGGNPGRQITRGHGPCDAEALGDLAAQPQQHQAMLRSLHSLGNDLTTKSSGEGNYPLQDG